MLAAPHMGSPYMRMWQDERPTVSTANSCGHGGKGDGTGAPPRWRQGRRWRKLSPSPNPWEGMTKRTQVEDTLHEDGEEGEVTPPPPIIRCPTTSLTW
jgi:hypothetical protein